MKRNSASLSLVSLVMLSGCLADQLDPGLQGERFWESSSDMSASRDLSSPDTSEDIDMAPDQAMMVGCAVGKQDNDGDGVCRLSCEAVDCSGHGTCDDGTGEVVCLCETGYQGELCGTCASGYLAVGVGPARRCVREETMPGPCMPGGVNPCMMGGECFVPNPGAPPECRGCPEGYVGYEGGAGNFCECQVGTHKETAQGPCVPDMVAPSCQGVDCGARGTCTEMNGATMCLCQAGYQGPKCGVCAMGYQDNDDDRVCAPSCAGGALACGPHGRCEDGSGQAMCDCDPGYEGTTCSACETGYQDNDGDGVCAPNCASAALACGANGSCDDSSGAAMCACVMGYQGAACDMCATGFQDNDGDGSCLPDCTSLSCTPPQVCQDAVGAAQCVALSPATCQELKSAQGINTDGQYTLYVDGLQSKPWTAYCVDMGTSQPAEYLELAVTYGENSVFERYGTDLLTLKTRYILVRLDPSTLKVDVTDKRFTQTTRFKRTDQNTFPSGSVDYATASSCSQQSGGNETGHGRIVLENTPFQVTDSFLDTGTCPVVFSPALSSAISSKDITLEASGGCGGVGTTAYAQRFGMSCTGTGMNRTPSLSTAPTLQLAYVGGFVSPQTAPISCVELKRFNLGSTDGEYTLYVGRDLSKPWTVYCKDMGSSAPKEYLTLVANLNDATANVFRQTYHPNAGKADIFVKYDKIRIEPRTLKVDITDRTFRNPSSTDGSPDSIAYATAQGCRGDAPGTGSVNLTGTPFFVDDAFGANHYCKLSDSATFSSNKQQVTLSVNGYCSTIQPAEKITGRHACWDHTNYPPETVGYEGSEPQFLLQLGYLP